MLSPTEYYLNETINVQVYVSIFPYDGKRIIESIFIKPKNNQSRILQNYCQIFWNRFWRCPHCPYFILVLVDEHQSLVLKRVFLIILDLSRFSISTAFCGQESIQGRKTAAVCRKFKIAFFKCFHILTADWKICELKIGGGFAETRKISGGLAESSFGFFL